MSVLREPGPEKAWKEITDEEAEISELLLKKLEGKKLSKKDCKRMCKRATAAINGMYYSFWLAHAQMN